MDIAIIDQFSNIIRWAVAFSFIYIALPVFFFPSTGESILEMFFSRFSLMVALTIVMGYILVALKLYEVLSMSFVFLVLAILIKVPREYRKHGFRGMRTILALWVYNFFDGLAHPYRIFLQRLSRESLNVKKRIANVTISCIIQSALLLSVLAYSAYLRFYDAIRHAGPSMSDAYVTLAWMKYINARTLFHDGIYPQGSHIYLSILQKFAACDALYILKYTGPLSGVLTTLGIYLFVTKLTGSKLPGILSAFIYGVLGGVLPLEWDRQASTNSQEFAVVFLLPAWSYAISYLQTRDKKFLWTALAAFAVLGLVHTLIFAFLWVGLACIGTAYLLLNTRQMLRPVGQLITAGIISGVVSGLPVPIALLFGRTFHNSSLEFLTSTAQTGIPILTLIDIFAVVGFILFFIISFWKRKDGSDLEISLCIFFIGVASFLMYLLIGPMTGKAVFVGRIGILWSLMASVGVGVGAAALLKMIPSKRNVQRMSIVSIVALVLMVWTVIYVKPSPPEPYKMQYDMEINQYLRISKEFLTSDWIMVSSNEGYDLALGKGWHIQLGDFLKWYDPQEDKLFRSVNGEKQRLEIQDLFIFIQKELFIVDMKIMEPILAQRVLDYAALEHWVAKYWESHDDLSVYYQDDFIVIYHIHQPKSKEEAFREIWGQGK